MYREEAYFHFHTYVKCKRKDKRQNKEAKFGEGRVTYLTRAEMRCAAHILSPSGSVKVTLGVSVSVPLC